jgi:ubiquinone/menaquinone biosynthesis C-methylase UbiE
MLFDFFTKKYKVKEIDYQKLLQANPLDASLHLEFAKLCLNKKNYQMAYAELRTAECLGICSELTTQMIKQLEDCLPELLKIDHNQYHRNFTLSKEIKRITSKAKSTVLDIGGGDGILSRFLSDYSYCLAEPSINGISGNSLPFFDKSFDVVVSCHVLEHIPLEERENFLDNLARVTKKTIILLNPFEVEGSHTKERLELFVEITDAQWAKEHLECSLPSVEFIENYASKRGFKYQITPNGTLTTSMAFVFVDYFAQKANCQAELTKINQFYNKYYEDILNSDKFPTAYLVTLIVD